MSPGRKNENNTIIEFVIPIDTIKGVNKSSQAKLKRGSFNIHRGRAQTWLVSSLDKAQALLI